ncbi:unnamed protein product [Miscanthus lutarioriparius]|uniref:GAG-pre-integrase domain-containing protein n=1 Tax=Miscanthus lutarioriparius TaxID=422564 RepID=A0A811QMW2_9POAL|nr:unnamed protein product [Miscanthus lutarioriparius]
MGEQSDKDKEVMERAFNQATGNLVERRRDRLALGTMIRGMPKEMHSMLLNKKTMKEAWDLVKTMRLGADHVKDVNAQKLLVEFESISFKLVETIDDFTIRITKRVFLNQEHVFPTECDDGVWVLDIGATNHMTGCRESLASLGESVHGVVRFGDRSMVEIHRIGVVTIVGKNQDHYVLTEIDDGVLKGFERHQAMNQQRGVLIRAARRNSLYIMKVNLTSPVFLMTKMDEEVWLWHARHGHLNFRSLHELGAKEMVEGDGYVNLDLPSGDDNYRFCGS